MTLAPDLAAAAQRNTQRPSIEQIDYDISGLHATIEDQLGARGWYFDTTHLDAASTARKVLVEAPRRGTVTASRQG
ncbi:hypothetical protein ACFEMC_10460 [Kineococcus sp. DHX-1]|uniref:hypothetical protein n=1 Tax=Kineococcus sp. DHX-1 TaxID=3349638 RepID=UPI0036D3BA2E